MMKLVLVLLLAVGFSHQVPVEDVEVTSKLPVDGENDVEEPDMPEMNPNGDCPEFDLEFPVYLSDTKNCSIFYQCANGVPYMMSCTYPLEFNANLQVCDFPGRSGCIYDKISPYRIIGRCPPNQGPGLTKLLRDSEDNTIYYECVNGQPELRKCPPNTIFNFRKTCEPVA